MYSRLLDEATLGAVISAGPRVGAPMHVLALEIAKVLTAALEKWDVQLGLRDGDTPYWEMTIAQLTTAIGVPTNDPGLTEKRVGGVVSEMGLQKFRRNDGYHLVFNREQVEILREALNGK